MKNDWETRWLPPVTLGIIRMTSLWLDHKKKKRRKTFLDIITGAGAELRLSAARSRERSGGKH